MNDHEITTPHLATWLLQRIFSRDEARFLSGDIQEIYSEIAEGRGLFMARLWLWAQILVGIPRYIQHRTYWSLQMLKNYFLIAFRVLRKHTLYSTINILGLSIGLACFILIGLFVRFERSFDTFHEKSDRIYRAYSEDFRNNNVFYYAPTPLPLADTLKREFPGIEFASRISQRSAVLLSSGDHHFYENIIYADPDVFDILTLPLERGVPSQVLSKPYSLVLTLDQAEKYFGQEDPIGRILTADNKDEYTVTGVLKDIPDNSHLRIKTLASIESIRAREAERWTSWDQLSNDYTYVLLSENSDPVALEGLFTDFVVKYLGEERAKETSLRLQPLKDIHFTNLNYDMAWTYERSYLFAFSAVGFFILLIACFNYMNLATARSAGRAREVGLRKVVGAQRSQLIRQFLTESGVTAGVAVLGAMGIVFLSLPWFRQFLGREIRFNPIHDPGMLVFVLSAAVFTGLASGSYPAFRLSSFRPVRSLRSGSSPSAKRFSVRTILVIFQFAISIILIVATLVVFRQINFMRFKDLGFQSDQILMISLWDSPFRSNLEAFKTRLKQNPKILGVSGASGTPGSGSSKASNFWVETPDGKKEIYLTYILSDHEFVDTFGLTIVEGRNFSRAYATDSTEGYILNETAVRQLGLEAPLGRRIYLGEGDREGQIIGVVKDFHYYSPRDKIDPMAILIDPSQAGYAAVRLTSTDMETVLPEIEAVWREGAPQFPFEHFFANESFERRFRFDRKVGEMLSAFAVLAVVICCLGIFGLISFTTQQSSKEIGIRKVLGGSVIGIVVLLSKKFTRWVVIANIVAWPAAWYIMHAWLQGFAYRTSVSPAAFFAAGFLSLLVAVLSISYQALKAALADPIKSLRYE